MLEDAVGSDAFQQGMRLFCRRSLEHPSGWEVLAESMQAYAPGGFDARAFLTPWIANAQAPRLTAEAMGKTVFVRQSAPYFRLPVMIEASTASGQQRKRVWVDGAETAVPFEGEVSSVRVDPDSLLLLRR